MVSRIPSGAPRLPRTLVQYVTVSVRNETRENNSRASLTTLAYPPRACLYSKLYTQPVSQPLHSQNSSCALCRASTTDSVPRPSSDNNQTPAPCAQYPNPGAPTPWPPMPLPVPLTTSPPCTTAQLSTPPPSISEHGLPDHIPARLRPSLQPPPPTNQCMSGT